MMLPFLINRVCSVCTALVNIYKIDDELYNVDYENNENNDENKNMNKNKLTDNLTNDLVKFEITEKINLELPKKDYYQIYKQTINQNNVLPVLTVEELSKKLGITIQENSDGSLFVIQKYYNK